MPVVTAVCRVEQLHRDSGTIGITAIDKRPVDGPVRVRPLGLYADVQADRKHHGGEDQAVYVYADEDAAYFAGQLDRPIPPGLFGENLRTTGIDVTGLVIGERLRIGDTLELEVTIPRTPCGTFARRMQVDKWVKRFAEEGRPGAYFRVRRSGAVAAGNAVTVLDRPEHGVTIGQMFAGLTAEQATAVLASGGGLAPKVVREAQLALRRAAV
ncbi:MULTISPECIES: MOSC domain-containing protein [unclassified Curtobacterium]|uniref:MOSC domain-containing protein n=1 Tax=unclassified Curtobacterium TaxID=257496 RepID=UPI000D92D857|nr:MULTISPECIES: MOSC domain-containing protein [unclassified Curtobacterium]PYY37148.1 MOSC domain-containing protein [Curtobacterium sp. MCBD17_030]PZE35394.1 MOSC domain-containing protein [Curtobacterium sp. MCPF17_031]PZF08968.1 MOSC domain-containing protein [Curtobacterium sp. MCPF17_011]